MTQSNIDFTQTMLKEILPTVKRLIEKEEAHLKKLQSQLHKIIPKGKKSFFNCFLYSEEQVALITGFIKECERYLAHYKQRQKEYEDYVLKN